MPYDRLATLTTDDTFNFSDKEANGFTSGDGVEPADWEENYDAGIGSSSGGGIADIEFFFGDPDDVPLIDPTPDTTFDFDFIA